MDRRRAITLVAGTLAWPLAARAQRSIPFVGFLNAGSPNERKHLVDAFRQGLKQGGYVDGKDVAIEYRWAEGRYDRLPGLARELVDRKVAIIVASGGTAAVVAAKRATSTIPIVFSASGDAVKLGLVASLGRPSGNVTGVTNIGGSLEGKRLQILRDLLPGATRVAYLINLQSPSAKSALEQIHAAADATAMEIHVLNASTAAELDIAFAAAKERRANALLVATDGLFTNQRERIVALAARQGIPACYAFREFAVAGGLVSYGADLIEANHQVGLYTARILKGSNPADLPVVQATKIELVVNLKTAKKLGLAISRDFLARVDEVIQ